MPKIFVSYRRKDSIHVSGRIYDFLVEQFGKENVLKDIDNIRPGVDFRGEIARLLSECDFALVVIGPQWIGEDASTSTRRIDEATDPVRVEIEFALERNIPIIPILFDGMVMERLTQLPASISSLTYRNGFEIRADPFFKQDLDLIIRRLRADYQSAIEREEQERQAQHARNLAEQERQHQESLAIQAKAEQVIKGQKDVIKKQKDIVMVPAAVTLTILSTIVAGYSAHEIWHNVFRDFGGNFVHVFLIALFGLVGLFVGFFSGAIVGGGLSDKAASAIVTGVGTLLGAAFGAFKGYGYNPSNIMGLIVGLTLGLILGGFVSGMISFAFQDAKLSPWYVSGAARIVIE